jgi:hypothetical protein
MIEAKKASKNHGKTGAGRSYILANPTPIQGK